MKNKNILIYAIVVALVLFLEPVDTHAEMSLIELPRNEQVINSLPLIQNRLGYSLSGYTSGDSAHITYSINVRYTDRYGNIEHSDGKGGAAYALSYKAGSEPQVYNGNFTLNNCSNVAYMRFKIERDSNDFYWFGLTYSVNTDKSVTVTNPFKNLPVGVFDITNGFNNDNVVYISGVPNSTTSKSEPNVIQPGHTYLIVCFDIESYYLSSFKATENEPPILNLSLSNTSWCKELKMNISATDNIALASISINEEFIPTSQKQYTINSNGRKTVIATDTSGNKTTKYIDVTNLDYTKPNVSTTLK